MAIKHMTVGEFSAEAHTLPGVVLSGDIIRVDCDEAGAFVIMEEPEYITMRDALEAMVRLGADGKLPEEFQRFVRE